MYSLDLAEYGLGILTLATTAKEVGERCPEFFFFFKSFKASLGRQKEEEAFSFKTGTKSINEMGLQFSWNKIITRVDLLFDGIHIFSG